MAAAAATVTQSSLWQREVCWQQPSTLSFTPYGHWNSRSFAHCHYVRCDFFW
eukprot:COSAG01_NODE_58911_length_303_cov_0.764706_1_plen_51_part_01